MSVSRTSWSMNILLREHCYLLLASLMSVSITNHSLLRPIIFFVCFFFAAAECSWLRRIVTDILRIYELFACAGILFRYSRILISSNSRVHFVRNVRSTELMSQSALQSKFSLIPDDRAAINEVQGSYAERF